MQQFLLPCVLISIPTAFMGVHNVLKDKITNTV